MQFPRLADASVSASEEVSTIFGQRKDAFSLYAAPDDHGIAVQLDDEEAGVQGTPWVIFDRSTRFGLRVDVRLAPKARGGLISKIHAVVDANGGLPVRLACARVRLGSNRPWLRNNEANPSVRR
jgi:hypothetical protein